MKQNYEVKEIKHLNAEVTRGCNLSCDYCFNLSGRRIQGELDSESWKKVFEHGKNLGAQSALITGGEVMTRGDSYQIVTYSLESGLETSILTNGFKLRENGKDFVPYLNRVQISLDSASPYTHDARRGEGSWKAARDAIDFSRSYDVPVEISTTVSPQRIDELEGIAGIAYATGSKILIRHMLGIGRSSNQEFSDEDELIIARVNGKIMSAFGYIFVDDFAKYVPILGQNHDELVLSEGFITILPNGKIRGLNLNALDLKLAA